MGAATQLARLVLSIGRLHIVVIAALGTFTFGWLFTRQYPWGLAAVCALDWFLVNLLNRVVDVQEDRENGIVGTELVAAHRREVLAAGFGLLAASLLAVHLWVSPHLTPLRLAFHALGMAYNWPLLPGRRRIKQLYFWKNTASATGFMLTVVGFPLAAAGGQLAAGVSWATVAVTGVFFALFELSFEVIYDLRDAPGDAAAGVRTYAVVHGQRGAVVVVDGLLVASVLTLAAGYAVGVVPWHILVMALGPLLQHVFYKRALRRGITAGDCVRLTWLGAALLAGYHLWVTLDLPGVA